MEESLPPSSTMQRQSLTISVITKSIDDVILENGHFLRESKGLKLQRVSKFDSLNTISLLYFGISVSEIKNNYDREEINDVEETSSGALISFYIGYSTWDGRVLFVDELPDSNTKTFLQILSKISIRLGCTRMNWMYKEEEPSWYASCTRNPPETLHEWLVLCMDKRAMHKYVSSANIVIGENEPTQDRIKSTFSYLEDCRFDPSFIETNVTKCLSSRSEKHPKFNLRLAARDNQKDAYTIARLVNGLALYEKEPDAVNCTAADYMLDGGGSQPLYYCILLDYFDEEKQETKTCGMAFIYFAYTLRDGPFLYLEDLFLEKDYRKKGGGSLALKCLAEIALTLNCETFVWTALDWNTPALNLYTKIGAKVQEGLTISRYTHTPLKEFGFSFC